MMCAFAPETNASYTFALTAAKFARALKGHDHKLAATYHQAAIRAFDWAQANHDTILKHASSPEDRQKQYDKAIRDVQNLAAVELFWLTGQQRFHKVFRQTTKLGRKGQPEYGQRNAFLCMHVCRIVWRIRH